MCCSPLWRQSCCQSLAGIGAIVQHPTWDSLPSISRNQLELQETEVHSKCFEPPEEREEERQKY